MGPSQPVEVVSRGHRRPKPYTPLITRRPGCVADEAAVPWPVNGTRKESLGRHGLWFKVSKVYIQPLGDWAVQGLSCDGVHVAAWPLFWLLLPAFVLGATAAAGGGHGGGRAGGLGLGGSGARHGGASWAQALVPSAWAPAPCPGHHHSGQGTWGRRLGHMCVWTLIVMSIQFALFALTSNVR